MVSNEAETICPTVNYCNEPNAQIGFEIGGHPKGLQHNVSDLGGRENMIENTVCEMLMYLIRNFAHSERIQFE